MVWDMNYTLMSPFCGGLLLKRKGEIHTCCEQQLPAVTLNTDLEHPAWDSVLNCPHFDLYKIILTVSSDNITEADFQEVCAVSAYPVQEPSGPPSLW